MTKYTNHLINETSPYLLQHAHNPVNWYPWGDEALQKAKQENKPMLVSIGYAACHWCHVMERESFEDEATARLMNENFVNIKIDREERPDLDHIYMDAVQAMTGSGGWPLNVFLTPEGKPFYGGTYFPPKRAYNRSSWQEVLQSISRLFNDRRQEVDLQAENLTQHLRQSNEFGLSSPDDAKIYSKERLGEAFANIMKSADRVWGGFGNAPKFPQTFTIQFLLRYHYISGDPEALNQALLSLDKMIAGGIYDQVAGGFARYSTDTEWLAPHFEKMLYDNALLISVISEAYQLTGISRYRQVIEETMDFVRREIFDDKVNAFLSALDADSEGEEGRFYVWNIDEIRNLLGPDADIFCKCFDVSTEGNWEGKNILRVKTPLKKIAEENGIAEEKLDRIIQRGRELLLKQRTTRVRPLLDDKVILGWNALMNTACSKAFMATGKKEYRDLAVANMDFMLEKFAAKNGTGFNHTWKNGKARYPAFLDDYAFLIQALIHLQEITADTQWLLKVRELTELVVDHFGEQGGGGMFYFTKMDQSDVIIRKKEIYDGAVPSGNSVMAYNLYQLSIYFDLPEWRERSMFMIRSLGDIISRYPTSFGVWACLALEIVSGTREIAVLGHEYDKLLSELNARYIPHRIIMASDMGNEEFPLLAEKVSGEKTQIYLCRDFACQQPVDSIERFMSLINSA